MSYFSKALAVLLFFLVGLPTHAEEMPEYEGVFIRTTSGDLIEIPAISKYLAYKKNVLKGLRAIPVTVYSIRDVSDAPVINPDQITSIVINSRDSKFLKLIDTAKHTEYFKANFVDYELNIGKWGYDRTYFKLKNIDLFNTELIFKNKIDDMRTGTYEGSDPEEIELAGFVISMSDGKFHAFFTPAPLLNYLEPALRRKVIDQAEYDLWAERAQSVMNW